MGIKTPRQYKPEELKNYIINGNFDVWQRGTSFSTGNVTTADRFVLGSGSHAASRTVVRSTDVPNYKSKYSLLYTVGTADAAVGASDIEILNQKVEGTFFKEIYGKTFTISFWVKSSLTGTFPFSVSNVSATKSYVTTYSVTAANTWEYKTVTIPWDSTASFATDNTAAITVAWSLMGGTTYQTATTNSWISGTYYTTSGMVNVLGTAGATFAVSQIMLNTGSEAAPFRTFGENNALELAACHRYCYRQTGRAGVAVTVGDGGGCNTTTNWGRVGVNLPVPMRDTPTSSSVGLVVYDTASVLTVASVTSHYYPSGSTQVSLDGTVASSLTAGRPTQLLLNAGTSNYLQLEAEL